MSWWNRTRTRWLPMIAVAGLSIIACQDKNSPTEGGNNPVPVVISLAPDTALAGGAGFTLAVGGSNFVSTSQIRVGGNARPTTYVSDTQLTTDLSAGDIASAGAIQVAVFNPSPGGGESSGFALMVMNPAPSATALSRNSANVGAAGFTLSVTGSGFVSASVVRWDGVDRPTTFVSGSEVSISIVENDLLAAGTIQITVNNPAPGGGESSPLAFTIGNPAPTLTSLIPNSAGIGGPAFTLTVNGTNFNSTSVVRWNGVDRTTTFVTTSQVTASIPASDIAAAGTAQITVFNPVPGGGESSPFPFSIANPAPSVTSLAPNNVTIGGAAFTLTVNGANFIPTSVVRWDGSDRTTTYVSGSQLTASIPASDLASAGTFFVRVFNPAPGGGESSGRSFQVRNPAPTLTSLSPATATAGDPGFTLTLDGSDFVPTSTVLWNLLNLTTTYVSSTQLTASVTSSHIVSADTALIVVSNPIPGGGSSTTLNFPVFPQGITALTVIPLQSNDLIYDATRDKIYASVPSTGGAQANTVTTINPNTGAIESSLAVGSEPNPLAISDDGQYLYVGLDGSATVQRVILATQTLDIVFSMGSDFLGPHAADDIEVLPGAPGSVAISERYFGLSPRHVAVAIYDDGIVRATETNSFDINDVIEFSSSSATLYGYNNETTEFGFRVLSVTAGGVSETSVTTGLISGFGVDIRFDGGRIYASDGTVIDPVALTVLGTFPENDPMTPDGANGKAFFLDTFTDSVDAYNTSTFTAVGSIGVPTATFQAGDLIRWGTDGLAYGDNGEIVIIRTRLLP